MNLNNFQYIGDLWVGSQLQKMSFIFDTGSAWTWVPSVDCPDSQCSGEHYDFHKSKGFSDTGKVEDVTYGQGYIKGTVVNDDIAISSDPSTMAQDVNFILVREAKDLTGLQADGLLGLSPMTYRDGSKSGEQVHLLMNELKKDKVIDRAMFAVFLDDTKGASMIHIGGFDQKIVDDSVKDAQDRGLTEQGIRWMPITTDIHWEVRLFKYKVDEQVGSAVQHEAIFDTGSSLTYVPKEVYDEFTTKLKKATSCVYVARTRMTYCNCNSVLERNTDFPELAILVGSGVEQHWFYMKPKDYFMYDR